MNYFPGEIVRVITWSYTINTGNYTIVTSEAYLVLERLENNRYRIGKLGKPPLVIHGRQLLRI